MSDEGLDFCEMDEMVDEELGGSLAVPDSLAAVFDRAVAVDHDDSSDGEAAFGGARRSRRAARNVWKQQQWWLANMS